MRRLFDLVAPLGLTALLLVVWEIACRTLHIPVVILPPPSAIAGAMVANTPSLLAAAWNTLSMALLALVVAAAIAWPIACAAALNPFLGRSVAPIVIALQVTPVVAIAPLVNVWAGLAHPERAVISLAVVVAFFPLFSGALTGLKSADPDLERLFDLYGATRLQRLVRLRLPAATPFVLEGLKVGAGLAVIGAVVAEFVSGSGAAQGLAWKILEDGNRLRTAEMFAALALLALMGAGLHVVVNATERWILLRWRGR